jgi:sugar phosphate isomerase/epimerase
MKSSFSSRRDFSKKAMLLSAGVVTSPLNSYSSVKIQNKDNNQGSRSLKVSLNAYSFNKPLSEGKMTLDDLLDFCAETGFDGLVITGYYFPGYPAVPDDKLIYHIRRKAFRLGIDLGCTGVRNDFTWADPSKRDEEKKLVKNWIVVAHKLGAPGLRIFSGNLSKEKFSWDERARWIADDIRECADFAAGYGIMLALQNHNDFLKTSGETEKLLKMVGHEWTGLMLDIGSYHTADPYSDIAANSKYAVTWQMKEKIFINENQVDTDYTKIIRIVRDCGYRGYLPLETLGEGDPYLKVASLFAKVKSVLDI